jgi:hypothetical protein
LSFISTWREIASSVSSEQWRQRRIGDADEQRYLQLAFGALALLDRVERRLDLDRLALGLLDRLDLAHDLALGAGGARDAHLPGLARAGTEQAEAGHQALANQVHDAQP